MKKQLTFTSQTGQSLAYCIWQPQGTPKGIVQLVHGMAEHIDRYDATAEQLNLAGYLVVGHTHLGHGALAKVQGYFAKKKGWSILVEDVHTLRSIIQKQYPHLPYYLLGHSMGSFVARTYCLTHASGLQGVILSGTGYFPVPVVSAGKVIAKVLCLAGNAQKPSKLLDQMNFGSNNRAFAPNRTAYDWLSRDDQQVDAYIADPHCGFAFTCGGYLDLFNGLLTLAPSKLDALNPSIPVLFFSGDQDPVGQNGDGVKRVYQDFQKAGVKDVSIKLYPHGRHEMFNETNKEEVWADLVAWLNQH